VQVEICHSVMKSKGWMPDDVLPGVIMVHDGYTRLIKLQNEGYAYLGGSEGLASCDPDVQDTIIFCAVFASVDDKPGRSAGATILIAAGLVFASQATCGVKWRLPLFPRAHR